MKQSSRQSPHITYRSCQIYEQKKLLSHESVKELSCYSVASGSVKNCCPLNWKHFQSSCYFFSTTTLTWPSSLKNCSEMGAHLVVINTPEEQEFLSQTKPKKKEFYIGLTDQVAEGQWQWVDDTPFTESLRDAKRVKEKYSMKARRTLELKIIDYSVDFEKSEIESYALK
ncbi:C-type lectin domain family 4 member e [Cricetulus griseus]